MGQAGICMVMGSSSRPSPMVGFSFPAHPVPEDGRMVSAFSHSDVSLGVNEPGLK